MNNSKNIEQNVDMEKIGLNAKLAELKLAVISTEIKNKALLDIAKSIEKNKQKIFEENAKDIAEAEKTKLSKQIIKRLKVDEDKLQEIIHEVEGVMKLPEPVGKTLSAIELDNGFELYQVTCPIGVIGAIFESRPDALVQISTLCLKSGNAVILKGGSEAKYSNRILAKIISEVTDKIVPGAISLIETREQVSQMLKLDKYIDLIIPRGSSAFVKLIQANSRIPVLGHSEGVCHVYVDKDADIDKAVNVSLDAKIQYPAACNAMETLLVHKDIAKTFLPKMAKVYKDSDVKMKGDLHSRKIEGKLISEDATEEDWKTEYGDLIVSIKVVNDTSEAINHINTYGSKHTDSIITENETTAKQFLEFVDASSVMWNCSTRFADGFRYGKGAEVGISTGKIHARGPVGLEGLTIYKYIVKGNGNIVKDYSGKNAKKYTHQKLNKTWLKG